MVDSGPNKPPRNLRECIEDLQQTYRILPEVDKDGSSDCRFAEDIYAKKQRHELEVASHLDKLKREKKEVIKKIREISSSPVIIGGSGFSVMPEDMMEYLKPDFGISGEGERSFRQLLGYLENPDDSRLNKIESYYQVYQE